MECSTIVLVIFFVYIFYRPSFDSFKFRRIILPAIFFYSEKNLTLLNF